VYPIGFSNGRLIEGASWILSQDIRRARGGRRFEPPFGNLLQCYSSYIDWVSEGHQQGPLYKLGIGIAWVWCTSKSQYPRPYAHLFLVSHLELGTSMMGARMEHLQWKHSMLRK
jgi:hypothetical protein